VPGVLAVEHRHAAVPAAKEHQARQRRHLHLARALARVLPVSLTVAAPLQHAIIPVVHWPLECRRDVIRLTFNGLLHALQGF
jgi:hypothetical protein